MLTMEKPHWQILWWLLTELYLQKWLGNLGNVVLYSDNCSSSLSGLILCFQYSKNEA